MVSNRTAGQSLIPCYELPAELSSQVFKLILERAKFVADQQVPRNAVNPRNPARI